MVKGNNLNFDFQLLNLKFILLINLKNDELYLENK